MCFSLWHQTSFACPNQPLKAVRGETLVLNCRLADLLGFLKDTFEPGKTYTADEPHTGLLSTGRSAFTSLRSAHLRTSLTVPPLLCLDPSPSRMKGHSGGGRTETFPGLQYKRLASGTVSQLTLTVLDTSGRKLCFNHVSVTLYIRNV